MIAPVLAHLAALLLLAAQNPSAPVAAPAPATDLTRMQEALRDPRIEAARQRYEAGDVAGAREDFARLCADPPKNGWIPFVVGDFLRKHQDYAAAIPFARQAFAALPEQPPAHNLLASCLLFTDRPEEAERLFRGAVARFEGTPAIANLVFGVGMACALNQKFLEADEWFMRAVAFEPQNALFHVSAGENFMNLHRLPDAEQQFRQAEAARPRHPDAAWKLGLVLAMQGKDEEAERTLRPALEEGPLPARLSAAFQLAVFLFERGRAVEAEPLLVEVTRARPEDRVAWNYLARTLQKVGKRADAARALARYRQLQAAANRSETEYLLGLIREQLEAKDPAKPDAPGDR